MPRCALTSLVAILIAWSSYGQKTTKNNYTGDWEDSQSWVGGVPAAVSNINEDLTINGFIKRNGNLSFKGGGPSSHNFIINDTLVIVGDLTLPNKAANLVVRPAAVLIIIGNFSAENKIVVENGGIFVVSGDMNFSHSGQDEYDDSGGTGELFVGGSVENNDDAEGGEANWDNLDDQYPIIYDYVLCGGGPTCVLPVKLLYFNAQTQSSGVRLEWATSQEENFYKFIVQRSTDGVLFESIGEVRGKGFNIYGVTTGYSFVDNHPFLGRNYYRLKAIDFDETFEYFGVAAVNITGSKTMAVFPNPISGRVISFTTNFSPQETDRVILMDELGVEIFNDLASHLNNNLTLENELKPGVYIIRYVSSGFEQTARVMVRN